MKRTITGLAMALSLAVGGAGAITATTAITAPTEAQAFGLGDIGGAIKKGVSKAGGAVKKGVGTVGRGIQKGGKALDSATRKAAKTVGKGVEKAGKTIGGGVKDIVRCFPSRCKVTVRKPRYPDYTNGYRHGAKPGKAQLRIGVKAPTRKVQGITKANLKPSGKVKGFATKDIKINRNKGGQRFKSNMMRKRDTAKRGKRQGRRLDRRSKVKVQKSRKNGSRKNRRGRRG